MIFLPDYSQCHIVDYIVGGTVGIIALWVTMDTVPRTTVGSVISSV